MGGRRARDRRIGGLWKFVLFFLEMTWSDEGKTAKDSKAMKQRKIQKYNCSFCYHILVTSSRVKPVAKLMLALISLIALADIYRSAHARSYWLLMQFQSYGESIALEKLEMESIEQCEVTGLKITSSQKFSLPSDARRGFDCLEAK